MKGLLGLTSRHTVDDIYPSLPIRRDVVLRMFLLPGIVTATVVTIGIALTINTANVLGRSIILVVGLVTISITAMHIVAIIISIFILVIMYLGKDTICTSVV